MLACISSLTPYISCMYASPASPASFTATARAVKAVTPRPMAATTGCAAMSPRPFDNSPTVSVSFPTMVTAGPMAATTAAVLMTVFFSSSVRPLHHPTASFKASRTFVRIGPANSDKMPPISAPRSLASFMAIFQLSTPSTVASKVLSTIPPTSSSVLPKFSKSSVPLLMALNTCAPLLPKISYA